MSTPIPHDLEAVRRALAAWLSPKVGADVTVEPIDRPAQGNELRIHAWWELAACFHREWYVVLVDAPDAAGASVRWFEPDPAVLGAPFLVRQAVD